MNQQHLYIKLTTCKSRTVALCLMLMVFTGFPMWMYWYKEQYAALLLISLIILMEGLRSINFRARELRLETLLAVVLFVSYFIFMRGFIFSEFHGAYLLLAIISVVISTLPSNQLSNAFEYLSKILAIILIVSLLAWLFDQFIFNIPIIETIDFASIKGIPLYMENHFFFVNVLGENVRFYSVFDEPGALGTLGAFVLYANEYDFRKWYNLAILICCVPTYSLAYIFLVAIGMAMYYTKNVKMLLHGIVVALVIIILALVALQAVPSFNTFIIYRLQNRMITSDYRSGAVAGRYFSELIHHPTQLFIGYGEKPSIGAASSNSYKNWILENGVIGLLVTLLLYWSFINKKTRKTIGLFILYWVSFIQRPGLISAGYVVLFVIAVNKLSNN